MTTAKIIYDLNDPDDMQMLKITMQASDVLLVIWEFDQWLRSQHKHGPSGRMAQYVEIGCEKCQADFEDMMFDIRSKFGEMLVEAGLDVEI